MQVITDLGAILGFETGVTTNQLLASLIPQTVTQATAGNSLSMGNYEIATMGILDVGAVSAGLTACSVQVEEWNGTTANGSTWTAIPNMGPFSVTTSGAYNFYGLRTQGYARFNVVTATGTTVNVPLNGRLLGAPRSEGQPTGFSRSPSV